MQQAAPAAGWPGYLHGSGRSIPGGPGRGAAHQPGRNFEQNGGVALVSTTLSQILFLGQMCKRRFYRSGQRRSSLSGIPERGYLYLRNLTPLKAPPSKAHGAVSPVPQATLYLTNGTAAIAKTTSDPIAGTNASTDADAARRFHGREAQRVVYSVTLGTGETAQTFDVTKENVELKGTWAPGMKYTYDLTLVSDAKQITLDPSVEPWTEGTITDQPLPVTT
ncbi:MAG: hypothetical protein ACLR8Y_00095 [Alistipes indistinctus]